jgi:hypothetical protein
MKQCYLGSATICVLHDLGFRSHASQFLGCYLRLIELSRTWLNFHRGLAPDECDCEDEESSQPKMAKH